MKNNPHLKKFLVGIGLTLLFGICFLLSIRAITGDETRLSPVCLMAIFSAVLASFSASSCLVAIEESLDARAGSRDT